MEWDYQRSTDATAEPITTATAKLHCKVDHSTEDALIASLVKAARHHVELLTGRSLADQVTWDYTQEAWTDTIWLPHALPLVSVTHVKYYDGAGVQQTLATSVYEVQTTTEPGRVVLAPDQTWPELRSGKRLPITIRYVAGSATPPAPLLQAMLLLIGHWYETRQDVVVGTVSTKVPQAAEALIAPWTVRWLEPKAA